MCSLVGYEYKVASFSYGRAGYAGVFVVLYQICLCLHAFILFLRAPSHTLKNDARQQRQTG